MSETARTPGPWTAEYMATQWAVAHAGGFICNTLQGNDEANAAFIVKAVNSHDALVAACRGWLEVFDELDRKSGPGDPLNKIRREFHATRIEATRAALKQAGEH